MEVQSLPASHPDGLDRARWQASGADWGAGGKLGGRLAVLTRRSSRLLEPSARSQIPTPPHSNGSLQAWRLLQQEPNLSKETFRIGVSRLREVPASLLVPRSTPEHPAGTQRLGCPDPPGRASGQRDAHRGAEEKRISGLKPTGCSLHTQSGEPVQANLDRWLSCPRSRSPD